MLNRLVTPGQAGSQYERDRCPASPGTDLDDRAPPTRHAQQRSQLARAGRAAEAPPVASAQRDRERPEVEPRDSWWEPEQGQPVAYAAEK